MTIVGLCQTTSVHISFNQDLISLRCTSSSIYVAHRPQTKEISEPARQKFSCVVGSSFAPTGRGVLRTPMLRQQLPVPVGRPCTPCMRPMVGRLHGEMWDFITHRRTFACCRSIAHNTCTVVLKKSSFSYQRILCCPHSPGVCGTHSVWKKFFGSICRHRPTIFQSLRKRNADETIQDGQSAHKKNWAQKKG